LSFFDEDDEPLRTTSRTRSRPAGAVRARRGRPADGGSTDAQTLLIRRMVFFFVCALALLLLVFVVKSCNDSRHKAALRDYNTRVSDIAVQSRQTGKELFTALGQGASQSPQELAGQLVSLKGQADTALTQAKALDPPNELKDAHQSLLIALELRRDALTAVAEQIKPALGDEGDAADRAINAIAGDMRMIDASDVLYRARVQEFLRRGLRGVGGGSIESSDLLKEISWLSPQYVASKLGQQLSTSADGGTGQSNQPTGPGLHGTGLNGTSYGNTTLQPGVSNRLTYVAGQAFTVSFTNQGDNDEFNLKVTLTIARASGAPLTLNKTVPRAAKGEKVTVTLPLNRPPPLDTVVTISVAVSAVPGEQKTDNNKSSYPSVFVRG
jgi:hypothetical protein